MASPPVEVPAHHPNATLGPTDHSSQPPGSPTMDLPLPSFLVPQPYLNPWPAVIERQDTGTVDKQRRRGG
ncbi:hypothetical protein E2562_002085 [Oryza meyeriana var. granulata]|uniref:Uncharacterized protein n=1 Tax=Oryza meyeriana var. granulata TaxID=110450 RepID=A0A6G1ECJ1_9ORYZ|nr:hypothetical protein E2562_002085 [Oryza meyeriana var. granulata]